MTKQKPTPPLTKYEGYGLASNVLIGIGLCGLLVIVAAASFTIIGLIHDYLHARP